MPLRYMGPPRLAALPRPDFKIVCVICKSGPADGTEIRKIPAKNSTGYFWACKTHAGGMLAYEAPPRLIWLGSQADVAATVDEIDYYLFTKWLWRALPDRHGRKLYAYRSTNIGSRPLQRNVPMFLHVEICKLARGPRPTPLHSMTDHINGDSLDCRRVNLRWATPRQNRLNTRNRY